MSVSKIIVNEKLAIETAIRAVQPMMHHFGSYSYVYILIFVSSS